MLKFINKKFLHEEAIPINQGVNLLFHRIIASGITDEDDGIPLSDFGDLVQSITEKHSVLPLGKIIGEKKGTGKLPDYCYLISFDDGYKDTYTNALPVIEKYKIPVTIYITTGFINRDVYPYEFLLKKIVKCSEEFYFIWNSEKYYFSLTDTLSKNAAYKALKKMLRPMNNEERKNILVQLTDVKLDEYIEQDMYMSWEQVIELSNHPLVTIGSHTRTHPQLNLIDSKIATEEIKQGKAELENKLDKIIRHFAYPYGGLNPAVREMVVASGFDSAATTAPKVFNLERFDKYLLPRITT